MKNRKMMTGIIGSFVVLLALAAIYLYIPLLSLLTIWFIPIPLMYLVAKHGWRYGTAALIVSAAFLLVLRPSLSVLTPVAFLITGYAGGWMLLMKKSAFVILLATTLSNIAQLILALAGSVLLFHYNPVAELKTQVGETLGLMLRQSGPLLNQTQGGGMLSQYQTYLDYIGNLAPSILVVVGLIYALIVEWIGLPILRKLGVDAPKWVPFRNWKVPKSVIWFFLIALLLGQTGLLTDGSPLMVVTINITFIMEMLLAVQGMSFIFFVFHHWRLPLIIPVLIAVLTVALSFLLLQAVTILGIIDLGFDLRRRMLKRK
ncbi:YybS family protein [Sporolactobacillus vineae]|uniref:YybS family protein n=1 Tax=Sporolactobacillus vineae TaxID=444463 RepID=UPI00028A2951|nr:YybS family protein [Sporolactobacillus vineae]